MDDSYTFPLNTPIVRILQITDPHLFASDEMELLGVNTTKSFQAVLDAIKKDPFDYDFILATGDLVQDHNREAYHRFAKMVKPLEKPIFWVEGNHDLQPQMGNALALYSQIQPAKHILAGDFWQIILLDSHIEGLPRGELSSSQLDFLRMKLDAHPERYSLIVLHHNILPTNSAWLDQHSLSNANQLAEVLKHYPKAKAILHGHIHQEMDKLWQGCRVLATPSTCIQFKPNCHNFTLDILPQGWRELCLNLDGSIDTRVKRLDCNDFLPDFKSLGY
ncbi:MULTISPECIES: 3',5'-cyclic-AMP phosphodiesterase [Glaesserella]|uniref:3',5'-cyclic adenosine monophosphate phosphodiesterase CpdA n=1 Tax=Glaesserella australis TaxID=2094024 RepID=A0A328BYW1_9PAST|nr:MULTISPECIES: 3',5'-cyclic-AMP phosphodiesterase [Glaesserella]AUI67200.1 3',5'-cyclic-AMP phosphodiesterase [Glaesserella sp. 15-184]RAL19538.1 3',5'-cyclic-AMP phosphodiesterase [Glaesserella australis]